VPGASTSRLAALRAANARPALRRLQAAWGGSFAGEAIAAVAFAVIAYRSAGASGIAFLVGVQMLPAAVLAPILTAAGRRLERERLVLAADLVRLVIVGAAAALSEAGAPREVLFALAAALTVSTAVSNPPRRALLPLLVGEPSELMAAGIAASVVQAAAQTAGPLLAAVLFTVTDAGVVLAVAAACFAAATVAEAGLPSTRDVAVRPHAVERALRTLARGARTVRSEADLLVVTGLFAGKNLARGALNVLIVLVPLELLGLGSAGVGWLTAIAGAGGVLGGIAAAALVGRRRLIAPMGVGLALWGIPLGALAALPHLPLAVLGLLVLGIGNTVTDVAGYTLIGRTARDDVLASVYAVHEAVRAIAITAGSAVTATVAELWGTRPALGVAGVGLVLSGLAGALLRAYEAVPDTKPEQLQLVRSNPLFGWLPPVALARLAARLVPLELPAGATLLRQGDPGDRAYLIARGELVAERDGREIGRLAAGAVVGEIALLHDAPRMASVHAVTDCDLLVIERDEFIAAATGSAGARDESARLVEGRLAEAGQPATG
jgi:MFS family permease